MFLSAHRSLPKLINLSYYVEASGLSTLVFPLLEWRLGPVPDVVVGLRKAAVLLLQVPPAVPAVRVLAEALSRLDVNAFGISDRGPGTVISVSMLAWADGSYNPQLLCLVQDHRMH